MEIDDAYLGSPGKGLAGRGTDKVPFIVAVNRGGGGCALRAVADCSSGSYLEFGSWHLARGAHIRADRSDAGLLDGRALNSGRSPKKTRMPRFRWPTT